MEITKKVKIIIGDILPKKLIMTSAKKVSNMVSCLPKILELFTRKSIKLSIIYKKVKI